MHSVYLLIKERNNKMQVILRALTMHPLFSLYTSQVSCQSITLTKMSAPNSHFLFSLHQDSCMQTQTANKNNT